MGNAVVLGNQPCRVPVEGGRELCGRAAHRELRPRPPPGLVVCGRQDENCNGCDKLHTGHIYNDAFAVQQRLGKRLSEEMSGSN